MSSPQTRSRRSHPMRAAVCLALVVALPGGLLAGCSSDDGGDDITGLGAGDEVLPNEVVDDPVTTSDAAPEPAIADVCPLLTAAEVGELVGGDVVVEEQPGGGCEFSLEDPAAPTLAFFTVEASDETDGTFNEARVGAFATLGEATSEEPSLGDRAAVASGTFGGGESQQGAGLVQVGLTIVQVTVVQSSGLDGEAVRTLVIGALELAATKL